jgi:hypothetical protein
MVGSTPLGESLDPESLWPRALRAALTITSWRAIRASLKALILGAIELVLLAECAWLSGRGPVSTAASTPEPR